MVLSKCDDDCLLKNKQSQVSSPGSASQPYELVYIQALKILNQLSIKKRVTRNIALPPGAGVTHPVFKFKGADNFHISDIKVISNTNLPEKCNLKRLELIINVKYDLSYSDGVSNLIQSDQADYDIILNNVYYPDCDIKCYPQKSPDNSVRKTGEYGSVIEVEALAQEFGDVISPFTGALILDIGVFFIIRFARYTDILVPSYGCFPAQPKQ